MKTPDLQFLTGNSVDVARRLLGCIIEREIDGHTVRVRIVETEAYDQSDAASHSYRGETERTRIMFGRAGYLYVYFTYGMHYCCNVVTGKAGIGAAVLIRVVEPVDGRAYMENRRARTGPDISNGPAKLCQALDIDMALYGHDLRQKPLRLIPQPPLDDTLITQTGRVGITRAVDMPWRFYITDNPYVSRP